MKKKRKTEREKLKTACAFWIFFHKLKVCFSEGLPFRSSERCKRVSFPYLPPFLRKRDQGSLYILIERSRHRRANRPNTQEKEESKLTNTKKQTRETTRETKLTNTREAEERKTTRETKLTGKEERQENRGTKDKVHSYKWRNEKKWPCRSVRCSLTLSPD